jgi:TetR/AcrR family transcriptional regulator, transcriptional repressor for nem operon
MAPRSTREDIVAAADRLFYRQGFGDTSFSDISGAVGISRGNFYHHFKSKDEILDAVIEARLANTQRMLDEWEASGNKPADRIRSFIHILIRNKADIQAYGCPVGTLQSELSKLDHVSKAGATALFTLFRGWLRRQFELMGRGSESDALAMHLLARSQGVAVLATAFQDEKFIRQEVRLLCDWLDAIEASARSTRSRKA